MHWQAIVAPSVELSARERSPRKFGSFKVIIVKTCSRCWSRPRTTRADAIGAKTEVRISDEEL